MRWSAPVRTREHRATGFYGTIMTLLSSRLRRRVASLFPSLSGTSRSYRWCRAPRPPWVRLLSELGLVQPPDRRYLTRTPMVAPDGLAAPLLGRQGNRGNADGSSSDESSDDDELPPTYSFLARVERETGLRDGLEQATGCRLVCITVTAALAWIVYTALSVVVPFAMVVVGAISPGECDAQPRVPTWMVCQGVIVLAWTFLLHVTKRVKARIEHAVITQFGRNISREEVARRVDRIFMMRYQRLAKTFSLVQMFG